MNAETKPNVIQVRFKDRRNYRSLGDGLEREAGTGKFSARLIIDRGMAAGEIQPTRTRVVLPGKTERAAREALDRLRSEYARYRIGLAKNPFARAAEALTISALAQDYLDAGCPKRKGVRAGKQLAEEQRRVGYIVQFIGEIAWDRLTPDHWQRYRADRAANRTRKKASGNRAIDLEYVTLNAILRLALLNKSRTGVDRHPLPARITFQDPAEVRHCRACMPESGTELHRLARALFADSQSEVLAWQMLFEAFIGHRTHEILRLRWDAETVDDPGFIERDENGQPTLLYLYHSTGHKGTYPYAFIHPALRMALAALREWRDKHYPKSPWFFPSPIGAGAKHVDPSSLTKALRRICEALKISQRTSHGMRAYFVNVLRSDRHEDGRPKLPDAEIALRVGQVSGGREIVDVYGKVLPRPLSWLPKNHADLAWLARATQLELNL